MGRAPRRPDLDDERAFAQAVRGARPLDRRTGRAVAADTPSDGAPLSPSRDARSIATTGDAGQRLEIVERWGERYALLASGADRRLLRELAGAEPQRSLDLHGLDAARASRTLRAFVGTAHQQGARRILVIHGRGHGSGPAGPVLRDLVIDALAGPPLAALVLAVANAPAALGGPGAALILLRRPPR
jgi:DNA-nicking Smr family endonuclease